MFGRSVHRPGAGGQLDINRLKSVGGEERSEKESGEIGKDLARRNIS